MLVSLLLLVETKRLRHVCVTLRVCLHVRFVRVDKAYELGTSDLTYSTRYNQYLMILHYSLLRVKSKLFSRAENVKKLIFWNSKFSKASRTLYELGT